jgi:hypothetical protein
MMNRIHIVLLMLLLTGTGVQAYASVASPVDRVNVQRGEGTTRITVEFLWPINVLTYTRPGGGGSQLVVELRFKPGDGAILANTLLPPWRAGNDPAGAGIYNSIGLDGELENASLTVDLDGAFDYTVQRDSDPRKLIIAIQTPQLDLPDTAGEGILAQGNQAFVRGDYDAAVALYSKLLLQPRHEDFPLALEYLGLTRERKGQLAHAKANYRDYLQRFPTGEGHDRVNQRLQALLGGDRIASSSGGQGSPSASSRGNWEVYGSWSQYYRYADISVDRSGSQYFDSSEDFTTQSDLLSRLDVTARTETSSWELEARFGGGYLYDLQDEDDPGGRHEDDVLLSDASVQANHITSGILMRAGRQYNSGDGVLGRFDGVRLEIPYRDSLRINLLGGRPVDLVSETTVDSTDRYFISASADFSPVDSAWDYSLFAMAQEIDGEEDRRAIGGELRYFSSNKSLFTYLDYDAGYQELNTLMIIANLTSEGGTVFGATADYRLSPVLTTRNALIGQQVDSIDELAEMYSTSEIRQLAEDRTADSHYVTLSITQPLGGSYQLYGAVSQSEFGETETSGGVEGYEGTGSEYNYEMQLIAANLLTKSDSHIFSLRYFDGSRTDRTALGINARYQLGTAWRVQPRVWLEYRENKTDGSEQWGVRPSIRVQYRWNRRYHFELELGYDLSDRDVPQYGDEEVGSTYFLASYRIDFN